MPTEPSYEIKSWTGVVLHVAKGAKNTRDALIDAVKSRADLSGAYLAGAYLARADLTGTNLTGADLARADLTGANLTGANLTGADLSRANLTGADLSGATLSGANLARATLSGAIGINARRCNDLLLLRDQPGLIRAYKLVTDDYQSPSWRVGRLAYPVGARLDVADANTDPYVQCAAGINVATLPWVLREFKPGNRIMVVEFTADDIAAIPVGDGKFRLHRCTVVREIDMAAELGIDPATGKDIAK